MMKKHNFQITPSLDNFRLDFALLEADLGISRRKIRRIIDVGGVYLNGKRVRVASRTVKAGDRITVEYSPEGLSTIKHVSFAFKDEDILYRDEHIVAVNKPPLMPSQATRDQAIVHVERYLVDYLKEKGDPVKKVYVCHRLDKETTGVLLLATSVEASTWVMEQFRAKTVKKTYLALCYGTTQKPNWKFQCYLTRISPKTGFVTKTHAGGRPSLTHFKTLGFDESVPCSYIECSPETGRSHQLRVHLELSGLPILGDKRYGSHHRKPLADELQALTTVHHFLHAHEIEFLPLGSNERVKVSAPLPPNFVQFLEKINSKSNI